MGRSLKQGYCMLFVGAVPTDGTARGMLAINAPSWEGVDTPADVRAFLARHFPALPPEWATEVRLGGRSGASREPPLCLPLPACRPACLPACLLSLALHGSVSPRQQSGDCCVLTPGCPAALAYPSLPPCRCLPSWLLTRWR